MTSWPNAA